MNHARTTKGGNAQKNAVLAEFDKEVRGTTDARQNLYCSGIAAARLLPILMKEDPKYFLAELQVVNYRCLRSWSLALF